MGKIMQTIIVTLTIALIVYGVFGLIEKSKERKEQKRRESIEQARKNGTLLDMDTPPIPLKMYNYEFPDGSKLITSTPPEKIHEDALYQSMLKEYSDAQKNPTEFLVKEDGSLEAKPVQKTGRKSSGYAMINNISE